MLLGALPCGIIRYDNHRKEQEDSIFEHLKHIRFIHLGLCRGTVFAIDVFLLAESSQNIQQLPLIVFKAPGNLLSRTPLAGWRENYEGTPDACTEELRSGEGRGATAYDHTTLF